jgi:hypothetical protein
MLAIGENRFSAKKSDYVRTKSGTRTSRNNLTVRIRMRAAVDDRRADGSE